MNTTKLTLLATTLAVGILCSGCGETLAQGIAKQSIENLALYEAGVTRKIDAERGFYKTQIHNLRSSLAGTEDITSRHPESGTVKPGEERQVDIEKTLLYGRIRTDAEGDAIVVAEALAEKTGGNLPVRSAMTTYLYDGVREQLEFQRELRARQARLAGEFNDNLAKLDGQKSKVTALRKELMKLERPVDGAERFKQLVEIGKAIHEQIKSGSSDGNGGS